MSSSAQPSGSGVASRSPVQRSSPAQLPARFLDTTLTLVHLVPSDLSGNRAALTTVHDRSLTVRLDRRGHLRAFTGDNTVTADYRLAGDHLLVTPTASTSNIPTATETAAQQALDTLLTSSYRGVVAPRIITSGNALLAIYGSRGALILWLVPAGATPPHTYRYPSGTSPAPPKITNCGAGITTAVAPSGIYPLDTCGGALLSPSRRVNLRVGQTVMLHAVSHDGYATTAAGVVQVAGRLVIARTPGDATVTVPGFCTGGGRPQQLSNCPLIRLHVTT